MLPLTAGSAATASRETASIRIDGPPLGVDGVFWTCRHSELRRFSSAADGTSSGAPVDVGRLSALLCGVSPIDPESSLFRDVRHVPAGASVTVDGRGNSRVLWDQRNVAALDASPLDAAEEIWRLVCKSVARAIAGKKRIGVLAGGGVDSSALLAAAIATSRGANSAEVQAIALDFAGYGDDRPYLRALEGALGIEALRVKPDQAATDLRTLLDSSRLPFWPPGAACDLALLRRAHELGADMVLTGAGGDDLFDGYPRLLANDVLAGSLDAAMVATQLQVPWSSTRLEQLSEFVVRPIVARGIPISHQRARRRRLQRERWPWAGPTLRAFIEEESDAWRRPRFDTPTSRFQFLARAPHLVDAVEMCSELALIAGVNIAHPYLDAALAEFTCSLPPRIFLHGGRLRGLFRLALRGRIPSEVRLRKDKASFANARRQMFHAAGGAKTVADLATMTHSAGLGLIEPASFGAAFATFSTDIQGDDLTWTWVWPALAVEGFLRARSNVSAAARAVT